MNVALGSIISDHSLSSQQVGVPVVVLSTKGDTPEKGYIRYVGETEFASGMWIGVQLDNMRGKVYLVAC